LFSSYQNTTQIVMKVMKAVDPDNVHHIGLAVIGGCMSCMVSLKDQHASLVAQGMDIGLQLSKSLRVYTEPLLIN